VIDPYGRMQLRLGRKADHASDTALPVPLPATIKTRHGALLLLVMVGVLLAMMFFRI